MNPDSHWKYGLPIVILFSLVAGVLIANSGSSITGAAITDITGMQTAGEGDKTPGDGETGGDGGEQAGAETVDEGDVVRPPLRQDKPDGSTCNSNNRDKEGNTLCQDSSGNYFWLAPKEESPAEPEGEGVEPNRLVETHDGTQLLMTGVGIVSPASDHINPTFYTLYVDDQGNIRDEKGTVMGIQRENGIEVTSSQLSGVPNGFYTKDSEGTRVLFLEDYVEGAHGRGYTSKVVGFEVEVFDNGAITYVPRDRYQKDKKSKKQPRVFAPMVGETIGDPIKKEDGEAAIIGTDIFLDRAGNFYDKENNLYLLQDDGSTIVTWGGGLFGGKVHYADAETGAIQSRETLEEGALVYRHCVENPAGRICVDDETGDKYLCTGEDGRKSDCTRGAGRTKLSSDDEKELRIKHTGMTAFGQTLDRLTFATRGLRVASLFYEQGSDPIVEFDETMADVLGGIDGWSSLVCRSEVTQSETVGISFSDGVQNAFAHIQGERATVRNFSSSTPNTFYLYKISFQVDPGSKVNGCGLEFQVFIGNKPLLVEQGSTVPSTFRLDKGNGSISRLGTDLIFLESSALYEEARITFTDIRPQHCMVGVDRGDSIRARLVDLGQEDLGLRDACQGLFNLFPSCWIESDVPGEEEEEEDSATQQQRDAQINPNV